MNFADWYTDLADVFRVVPVEDGALTRQVRQLVLKDVPCRIYQPDSRPVRMEQTASNVTQEDRLAMDNAWEIRAGDELLIRRGGALGRVCETIRTFASDPNPYFEPFGAVIPSLAHQEIRLYKQERVK